LLPGPGATTSRDSIVVAVAADEIQSMLVLLQARPEDVALRKRAAEALDAQGKLEDAILLLHPLINLGGHEDDTGLPCLCKQCFSTAPAAAEADGQQFTRSFAVTGSRVLHFWQLAGQNRADVRNSVGDALATRLVKHGAKK